MNRSVTLSVKGVLVALVAALALLVAYLLGNAGGTAQAAPSAPSSSAPAAPPGHARTLVMTGTGHTVGVPDELSFSVSVGLVRPDLTGAFAAANATMDRVLAGLGSSGVRRSDVQTTALSMNAVYDYHSSGHRRCAATGYPRAPRCWSATWPRAGRP